MIITQQNVDDFIEWIRDYDDIADLDLWKLAKDIIEDYDDEEDHVLQQPSDILPMIHDYLFRHQTGQLQTDGIPLEDFE